MSRILDGLQYTARPLRRVSGPRTALMLPAAALLLAVAEVKEVVLSSSGVVSGSASRGAVTLKTHAVRTTTVALSSSNPSVASVPSSVGVLPSLRTATFFVSAPPGAAGCATISARVGSTPPQSAFLLVHPTQPSSTPVSIRLSQPSVAGSNSLTGTVVALRSVAGSAVVQLSSSNPAVGVPASVTVPLSLVEGLVDYIGEASFPITTTVVAPTTCAVITATLGGSQSRVVLKVVTISG